MSLKLPYNDSNLFSAAKSDQKKYQKGPKIHTNQTRLILTNIIDQNLLLKKKDKLTRSLEGGSTFPFRMLTVGPLEDFIFQSRR